MQAAKPSNRHRERDVSENEPEQRCAECACEKGGTSCKWIAPAKTPEEALDAMARCPYWNGLKSLLPHEDR